MDAQEFFKHLRAAGGAWDRVDFDGQVRGIRHRGDRCCPIMVVHNHLHPEGPAYGPGDSPDKAGQRLELHSRLHNDLVNAADGWHSHVDEPEIITEMFAAVDMEVEENG